MLKANGGRDYIRRQVSKSVLLYPPGSFRNLVGFLWVKAEFPGTANISSESRESLKSFVIVFWLQVDLFQSNGVAFRIYKSDALHFSGLDKNFPTSRGFF